jgi:hypothetical protein
MSNFDFRMGTDAIADSRVFNKTRVEIEARRLVDAAAGTGGTEGAFFTMRVVADAVDPDDNGDIYLQGGMVSGGTGNIVIDEIKLYDAFTDTWVGSDGDTLIITVTGNGQETSGILDPIYNVTAAAATIGTVGSNTLPAAGSVSGKTCYILLGTYLEAGFAPSSVGNIMIGFCWGNYTISRT